MMQTLREQFEAWQKKRKWLKHITERELEDLEASLVKYPLVTIVVEDAGDQPFALHIKTKAEHSYTQKYSFATLEEAEARAAEFRDNLRKAEEANKRIQEMFS